MSRVRPWSRGSPRCGFHRTARARRGEAHPPGTPRVPGPKRTAYSARGWTRGKGGPAESHRASWVQRLRVPLDLGLPSGTIPSERFLRDPLAPPSLLRVTARGPHDRTTRSRGTQRGGAAAEPGVTCNTRRADERTGTQISRREDDAVAVHNPFVKCAVICVIRAPYVACGERGSQENNYPTVSSAGSKTASRSGPGRWTSVTLKGCPRRRLAPCSIESSEKTAS